jgi:hypothetical protein
MKSHAGAINAYKQCFMILFHFYFEELNDTSIFAVPKQREFSSAGSEHSDLNRKDH